MPGSDVADLVADDECERIGLACLPTDFEQVAVDDDETAKSVPRRKRVDPSVPQHDVGIRRSFHAEPCRSLGNQLIPLRKL